MTSELAFMSHACRVPLPDRNPIGSQGDVWKGGESLLPLHPPPPPASCGTG